MDSIRLAVEAAAKIVGSRKALAHQLGISTVAVGQWGRDGAASRGVPPKQCVRIERITSGKVTRRELRPDDWREIWPELAGNDQAREVA